MVGWQKPNSITLVGSELVRSWFEPDSVIEFGFEAASNQLRTSSEPASVKEFGFKRLSRHEVIKIWRLSGCEDFKGKWVRGVCIRCVRLFWASEESNSVKALEAISDLTGLLRAIEPSDSMSLVLNASWYFVIILYKWFQECINIDDGLTTH